MEIKTTEAQPALCLRLRTQLSTLPEDVSDHPEKLMSAVTEANLQPNGPMVFVYRNMAEDISAPFDLEIALPVASTEGYQGDAVPTTLQPLRYAETIHAGDLSKLGESYESLFGQIGQAGLSPAGETREVYTHYVDSSSADNITHIQVGV